MTTPYGPAGQPQTGPQYPPPGMPPQFGPPAAPPHVHGPQGYGPAPYAPQGGGLPPQAGYGPPIPVWQQPKGGRIVRLDTGAVPRFGMAAVRMLIPAAGVLACGIGTLLVYASPLFDRSVAKQGWHDMVAKTMVIATRPGPR